MKQNHIETQVYINLPKKDSRFNFLNEQGSLEENMFLDDRYDHANLGLRCVFNGSHGRCEQIDPAALVLGEHATWRGKFVITERCFAINGRLELGRKHWEAPRPQHIPVRVSLCSRARDSLIRT